MKSKLTMMVAMAAACAAIQLVAMPTEEETRKSEPVVKKMLASEREALKSGKKTRSEVAAAAMKLADEADTDAVKLLLMKGAFVLYVRDGKLEKAVETMKALKATIPDIPPQSVTNIIEAALLEVSKKEDGAPLYKLLDESKADIASIGASSMVVKERNSIASILKGMIKVPGSDLWLSETELTQGQWEAVMGNNPSLHKGVNLPVENISRDECDIFLEKLNQTKEVQASQFEFCLPGRAEWAGAARAGNPDLIPWIKPGVAGELLDMAWLKENSDGETHAVATKVPNAFGFYDMVGNVHEWVIEAPETRGTKRGYSFANPLSYCRPGRFSRHERNKRFADTGLRLAAHVRPQPALMTSGATGKTEVAARKSEAERVGVPTQKMSVTAKSESDESKKNEMKLPYEVVDGAVVLRSRGLQSRRIRRDDQKSAVVKISSGELVIPDAIDGIPVRSIGYGAFSDCKGLTAVTIPSSVTNIYDIAFSRCSGIKSFSVASDNPSYSSRNGLLCTKDGATLVAGVIGVNGNVTIPNSVTTIGRAAFSGRSGLKNVTIPSSVTGIVANAFSGCNGITSFSVDTSNASYSSRNGMLWTKDGATLVAGVVGVNGNVTIPEGVVSIGSLAFSGHSGLKSVTIPNGVTNIGNWAFHGCSGLTSVAIPEGVTSIGAGAFLDCRGLTSVTIPNSVTSIGVGAFCTCSALKSVTMCGERPNVPNSLLPNNIFGNCGKLKSIHVPANAKSWAGMKEWQGIPLVFDGESKADGSLNGEKDVEYKFAYKLDDKGNAILTGVSPKPEGALVCPNIIEGHKVTGIDKGAFGGCDKMTKIMLPEELDTLPLWISGWCIHGSIFYGCTALSSIGISEKNLKFASVDGALYSKDKKVLFAYPKDRTEIKVCRETTSLQGEAFHSSLLFKKINVPEGILDASGFAFSGCPNLEEVVFPKGFEYIRHRAFWSCPNMKKVVFLGEAPVAPHRNTAWRENVFCGAARDIVVYVRKGSKGWNGKESTDLPERWPLDGSDSRPIRYIDEADAKSWAGVKDGQGIPLVFDGEQAAEAAQRRADAEREALRQKQEELRRQREAKQAEKEVGASGIQTDSKHVTASNFLTGPYGIRVEPDPGCEKGAEYVLKRLVDDYLPAAVRYYGDPFGGKEPSRVFTLKIKRNDGKDRKYTGPSWGGRGDGTSQFTIGLAKGSDKWDMDLTLVANKILTVCHEDVGFHLYVNDFVRGDAKGIDPVPEIKEKIRKGLAKEGDENIDRRLRVWREYAPMWSVFEELRARHPNFMLEYCNLKNSRYAEGKLPQKLSFDQMADLLGEVTGENMVELFKKYGAGRRESQKYPLPKISVAQALQSCDFLLNKDFKRNAKFYLCLFSASWCGPCRAEMPRIAKTYAETLKNDPNIELIHFSRDHNDEKALAWAKEHDVKFPVVKPNSINPLDLQTSGIPHLFIIKADGTLVEDGHPMKLFTDEKLRELKSAQGVSDMTYTDNGGCTWSYTDNNNEGSLTITGVSLQAPSPVTIPTSLNGQNVTRIGNDAFRDNAMITGVTIPGCIVGIGDRAFVGCTNLEELTILEGVKAIGGSDAFRWCPKLKTVTLPKSLTFIRQRVFRNGGGIENVNVDSVESYMSIGFGTGSSTPLCSGKACLCVNGARLVDLIVPVGCRRITASAFNGANGLRSITIPGSVSQIGCCAFDNCSSNVVIRFANDIGALTLERNVAGGAGCPTIEVLSKSGCPFLGWFDKDGNEVKDPFHSPTPIVVTPRWNTKEAFALNAAPGSVTKLDLGNVPPLQFIYCPAGKFSMGYKEQPALSKVKEIEITSPFWVSKTPIRVDQLASLGINSITDARIGAAGINDASIVVQELPSVLKARFGKMLPPGYVFRLPTEAEFEYLQKAETKDKNAPTNIWGVERLYAGGYIGLLDRAPEYGKGVDVVNRWHDAMAWTDLVKVNYENQPDKDPVGWSDNPNWSVFRRGLARNCGGGKLITTQCNSNLYGFYFVVAPDVDKLNKFYWK